MATSTTYSLFPASFVHAGGTLNLQQLQDVGLQPDARKALVIPGGALDAGAVLMPMAEPRARFVTRDLTTLLGTVSLLTGLACTGACTLRYQKRTNGGTFATSTSHVTLAGSSGGFVSVDEITAEQDAQDGCRANCSFWPFSSDGITVPIAPTDSVDFDAASQPAFTSAFFLGPAYLDSTEIDGVVGCTIRSGINFRLLRQGGEPHQRTGHIVERTPEIRLRILKVNYLTTMGLFGAALGASLKVYMAKGVHGGARVSYGSSVHLKVTVSAGDWTPDSVQVAGSDHTTVELVIRPSTALAFSVASAIP